MLIPQILLSGVIVRFEKLNPAITRQEGVPLIGNIMTSRWAYEALSVEQFANNPFEKKFFEVDAVMSRATYKKDWWISSMRERLDKCEHLLIKNAPADSFRIPLTVLTNGFSEEENLHSPGTFRFPGNLLEKPFTGDLARQSRLLLDSLKEYYIDRFNNASESKENTLTKLTNTPQRLAFFNLEKNKYENESLEEMVKSSNQRDRLVVTNEKIIQRFEPVFHINKNENFFQAPLFSSVKNFAGTPYKTMPANIFVIWSMTLLLYVLLYLNFFRRIIQWKWKLV